MSHQQLIAFKPAADYFLPLLTRTHVSRLRCVDCGEPVRVCAHYANDRAVRDLADADRCADMALCERSTGSSSCCTASVYVPARLCHSV